MKWFLTHFLEWEYLHRWYMISRVISNGQDEYRGIKKALTHLYRKMPQHESIKLLESSKKSRGLAMSRQIVQSSLCRIRWF